MNKFTCFIWNNHVENKDDPESEIVLPFVPFVGMAILGAEKSWVVEDVAWDIEDQDFTLGCYQTK